MMKEPIRLVPQPGLLVRPFELLDAAALSAYHLRNEGFHREWSPIATAEFFTEEYQRARIGASRGLMEVGREVRFGIFAVQPEHLIGTITLGAIERGAFHNGRFGYSIDGEWRRRGIMAVALTSVIGFAFDSLGLHRLEANIMPRNAASRGVLERCGFTCVGRSPRMLKINGVWEDHDMYMRLAEEA